MTIGPINMYNGVYNFNYAKTPNSKIFAPIELNDHIYGLIQKNSSRLEYFGQTYDLPIKFAPKGNSTLMNIGSYTTIFNNNVSERTFSEHLNEQFARFGHPQDFELYNDPLSKRLRWAEKIVSKMEKFLKIKL